MISKIIKLVIFIFILSISTFAESLDGITLKDLNNQSYSFGKSGKPTFLKIWASWCTVCLDTLEDTDNLTKTSKNFDVVTVVFPNISGEKDKKDFIKWYKSLGYKEVKVLLDEKGELLKKINVVAFPTSVFLNSNANIVRAIPGALPSETVKKYMGYIEKSDTNNVKK